MSLKSIWSCFRCVLAIVVAGALAVFFYFKPLVTPLAIRFLDTEVAEARVMGPTIDVETEVKSGTEIYHTSISYSDYEATLRTLTPPVCVSSGRFTPNEALHQIQEERWSRNPSASPMLPLPPPKRATFQVRFIKAHPWMVVQEIPGISMWYYYGDMMTGGDWMLVLVLVGIVVVAMISLWKNFRKRRPEYDYER